jgi:uncharacterized membrane protein YfcA
VVVAVLHLLVLLAVLGWSVVSLVQGNFARGVLVLACLAIYYIVALHPRVKQEIARKRSQKS